MADNKMESRTARLRGRSKKPNAGVLALIALVSGLALGGAGVAYWSSLDRTEAGPALDTSDTQEFESDPGGGMAPVIAPAFNTPEQGPSETEKALRARVDELDRLLKEARNAAPEADTQLMETLQTQIDGLTSDMENRQAEMSDLAKERDKLRGDVQRQKAELARMELRLEQADEASLEEQRLAEEQEDRKRELTRRRAEAQAIAEAQINSPLDGLSGASADQEEREYDGDEAFIRAGSKTIRATQSRVIGAPSNTVMQGTVIEATLTTGINSELSGTISGTVSHDIWAFDMSQVLIPRGSKMFGRYSNGVALGQRRVLAAWDRLVTPDGQVVDLEAYGSDRLGRSGLTGRVNTRFVQRFGSAALISVFAAVPAIASASAGNADTQVVIEKVGGDAGDTASSVVEDYLTLGPVITVDHGDVIMVMVTNDLELF